MPRLVALALAAAVVGSLLGVLVPRPAEGSGQWVRFLFTPQAGVNSACLSCGWHSGACGPTSGPALDFGGLCTDTQAVYFRSWGFKPSGGQELVGYGAPFTVPQATCKTTYVDIYDFQSNFLGTMYYVHTYQTIAMTIALYVHPNGYKNEHVLGGMAKKPWEDGGIPDSEKENQACYNQQLTEGVHLHEYHADGASTFIQRDKGSCTGLIRYPCGPQSGYPTYNPQDWWNDWAREFCIDDADCDGFTDDEESYIGTDPEDDCADTPAANDEDPDAWPPDFNDDQRVNLADLLPLRDHWNCQVSMACYDPRFDLNTDGRINLGDITILRAYFNTICA